MMFTWLTRPLGAHHILITSMYFHREQVWCEATGDEQRKDIFIHIFSVRLPLGGSGALIYPLGGCSMCSDRFHFFFFLAVQESCPVAGLKPSSAGLCRARTEAGGSTLPSQSISLPLHGSGDFSSHPCAFPSRCSHTSPAANDSVCLQRRRVNRNQAEFEPLWDCFTH